MNALILPRWLTVLPLFLLCSAITAPTATAQTPQALESALAPGKTVWITDSSGREEKARVVSLTGDTLTAAVGNEMRRLSASEVTRVRQRRNDSVLNGALIGAGVLVTTGLVMCTLMEPWENCRDDVGPMLTLGAIGAGIGMGIDALIRGRETTYTTTAGDAKLQAAPILTGRTKGVRFTVTF